MILRITFKQIRQTIKIYHRSKHAEKVFRRLCACHKNENWWWIQKRSLHDKKDFTFWNLILCWFKWVKWTRNILIKLTYIIIKKRDKFLFDVDDFINVVVSAWIKNDSEFFHECMSVQMTFFILMYCFTKTRIALLNLVIMRNDTSFFYDDEHHFCKMLRRRVSSIKSWE
jgi:hypothetical protein